MGICTTPELRHRAARPAGAAPSAATCCGTASASSTTRQRDRAGARRHRGDRHFPPALLLVDGGMERRSECADRCMRRPGGVVRPDPAVVWESETQELVPGVTLIGCGGHFAGGTVPHWAQGAGGQGALLSGDILQVGPDKKVSFMRSYPDLIRCRRRRCSTSPTCWRRGRSSRSTAPGGSVASPAAASRRWHIRCGITEGDQRAARRLSLARRGGGIGATRRRLWTGRGTRNPPAEHQILGRCDGLPPCHRCRGTT